jgi:CDP-6-deoxy-D-xylo-4-hexulose-3-dehydrase
MTVSPGAPFTRAQAVRKLEAAGIETRMLFAGNILRQPAYREITHGLSGRLVNADLVTTNTFLVGVYPGLTDDMVDYMAEKIRALASD